MFGAYFTTSYFPSGWSGSRDAAAPGQMRLFAGGTSTLLISVRGWATSGTAQGGSGSILAPAVGRGFMALAVTGTGSLTSTIQGAAGGPTFGDMACTTGGTGSLAATFYQEQTEQPGGGLGFRRPWRAPSRFGDMVAHLAGRGGMAARVIGDRRVEQLAPVQPEQHQAPAAVVTVPVQDHVQVQEAQDQPAVTFADATVQMGGGSSTRASVLAYGDCAAAMGGSGALQAAGDLAYDDTEEIALALLLLMRAA